MKAAFLATAFAIVLTVTGWARTQHHEHAATQPSVLNTPEAMQIEHRHLHEQLAAALAAGGKTALAAKQVQAALAPHFAEEEAYAMPPLSLLPKLAQREPLTDEQIHLAIEMTDKLL